jgi:hypothetical protein
MQQVYFQDLGQMGYKAAWDYQEELLRANVECKSLARSQEPVLHDTAPTDSRLPSPASLPATTCCW